MNTVDRILARAEQRDPERDRRIDERRHELEALGDSELWMRAARVGLSDNQNHGALMLGFGSAEAKATVRARLASNLAKHEIAHEIQVETLEREEREP